MIVKTLEFLVGIGVLLMLGAGTIAGYRGMPQEPVFGAIVGFLCALVVAALVFGVIAALLDVREQLIRIRMLLEDQKLKGRDVPPQRIVQVPPSAAA